MDRYISANMLIKKQRGMSQSVLAKCSDGGYYVLKFKNNPRGLNALVSEVVTRVWAASSACQYLHTHSLTFLTY